MRRLRASEVVALKVTEVDSERMTLLDTSFSPPLD